MPHDVRAATLNYFKREFKISRRRQQRERQKVIVLISKTTTPHGQHTFLYISLPPLHDCDAKMPSFTFYGGREQETTKFSFSFRTWIRFLRIHLQTIPLAFHKISELE